MECKRIFDYKPSILGIPHLWKTPHIKLEGRPFFRWISQCFPWAASRLDTLRAIVPQRPQVRLTAAEERQLRSDDGHGHSLIQVCRLKYYTYIYIHRCVYICVCVLYYVYIYIQLSMYLSIYYVRSCSIHPKKIQTYGLPSGLDEHPPYTEHDFKKIYISTFLDVLTVACCSITTFAAQIAEAPLHYAAWQGHVEVAKAHSVLGSRDCFQVAPMLQVAFCHHP